MHWTIIAVLAALWLLGLVSGFGGSIIHVLLVMAALVFIYNLLTGRKGMA